MATVARATFDEIAEILRGFLPGGMRDFRHTTGSQNLRVWFRSWHEHYEIQEIAPPFVKSRSLEIGLHLEHPRPEDNDEVLDLLVTKECAWRKRLGPDPVAGPFIGRKEHRARWRRCSELWEEARADDEGLAIEAAERLGVTIATFEPLLTRDASSKCACWKEAAR